LSEAYLTKASLIALLRQLSALHTYHGENPFKIKAYDNAARALAADTHSVADLVKPGGLESVKGIGKGIAAILREAINTGTSPMLIEMSANTPRDLAELLDIPKLGVVKIKKLHEQFQIQSVDDLVKLCESGDLGTCPGFTKQSSEKILAAIAQAKNSAGKMLLHQGLALGDAVLEFLVKSEHVIEASVAGSARRQREVINDLDFVAASNEAAKVMDYFCKSPLVESIIGKGPTKSSVLLTGGTQADLRVVTPEQYPATLHHFTGSKEHNTLLRSRALTMGLSLNEYGFSQAKADKKVDVPVIKSETDLYQALGLAYVPPELREGLREVEWAAENSLPTLVEESDYRGPLHCHSTWSDGLGSIADMAEGCRERGWEYIAITDHSQLAAYAGGLKPAQLLEQQAEIDEANAGLKSFKIFKGCECDILADGRLDYSDDILETMDLVVASVHSRFNRSRAEQTARLVQAIQHPLVTILGHPTGRLLLSREPYDLDMDAVLEAAAQSGTVIEINADPRRLDLDWRYVQQAATMGIRFSINPDAHSVKGLDNVRYGIAMARKAGLEKEQIINCLSEKELTKFLVEIKKQKRAKSTPS